MKTLRTHILRGQSTIEFAIVAPLFFAAFFISIVGGSVVFFERAVALEAISSLGSNLPTSPENDVQDWCYYVDEASSEEVEDFVRYLLLEDEDNQSLFKWLVAPERVSVTGASITLDTYSSEKEVIGVVGVDDDNAETIKALGLDSAQANIEVVTIRANIEYSYSPLGQLFGFDTATGGVARSYVVSQDYVYALD